MKKIAIASLLTALLASQVYAETINVPFTHKLVPSAGLTITYNTYGTNKVICTTENFYKGYVFITNDGVLHDTGIAYSDYDNQEFYFTSVGSDSSLGDIEQFHVDAKGSVKLVDTHFKPHLSYASCFYAPEAAK